MKRYFYTDPLAAAWMVKHFGMRFPCNSAKCKGREYSIGGLASYCAKRLVDQRCQERFYIHPDSLTLLKPQIGDWVKFDDVTAGIISDKDNKRKEVVVYFDGYCLVPKWSELEIIQRDEMAFMWPKSEEA